MMESFQKAGRKTGIIRRFRRLVGRVIPFVIWVMAIVLAFRLNPQLGLAGRFTGYAESRPVIVAHAESGMVRELRVGLHQVVEPGEILLKLDDHQERLHLATISSDLERIRKEVDAARVKLELDQVGAELNQEGLSRRLLVDREAAHIQYLDALVQQASDQARLDGKMIEYGLVKGLHDEAHGTFRELNIIKTEVDTIRERIEKNKSALARMEQAFKDAEMRWFAFSDREPFSIDYDTILTPLRLAVDVREREIAELTHQIDQHALRAPIRGQVTALHVAAGDTVIAGNPLVTISPTTTQFVIAYLPEDKIASMQIGDPVRVYPVAVTSQNARIAQGRVFSQSDVVIEAPLRYRRLPTLPVWGRETVIKVMDNTSLLPGEAVSLMLDRR